LGGALAEPNNPQNIGLCWVPLHFTQPTTISRVLLKKQDISGRLLSERQKENDENLSALFMKRIFNE